MCSRSVNSGPNNRSTSPGPLLELTIRLSLLPLLLFSASDVMADPRLCPSTTGQPPGARVSGRTQRRSQAALRALPGGGSLSTAQNMPRFLTALKNSSNATGLTTYALTPKL